MLSKLKLNIILLLAISINNINAQQETDSINEELRNKTNKEHIIIETVSTSDNIDIDVPFSVIETVPVYPGCENGNNKDKKACMSNKIAGLVAKKFKIKLAENLGLSGAQRINVIFKINKSGKVTDIRARGPHKVLEKEAIRVISLLPKMKPGKHKGKTVTVQYALPIIFTVN